MSDDTNAKPFATSGSGKSPEEVAFDLVNKLKGQGVWGERNMSAILDMYAECLDATRGLRPYAGQNRIETPIKSPVSSQAPVQTPPVQQTAAHISQPQTAHSQAAQPTQAQLAQAQMAQSRQAAPAHHQALQNPVQAQQVHLQQAFKSG